MHWKQAVIDVVEEMGEVTSYLWNRGWAERNAGNISVDVTDLMEGEIPELDDLPRREATVRDEVLAGRCFFVTVTGARFRDCSRHPEKTLLLARVTDELDGYHVLWGGEGTARRATSEFVSHLKIHGLLRSKGLPFRTVLHTHPTELIALSHMPELNGGEALNRMLWGMHPEVKVVLPEGVGFAPYCTPGTESLADATMNALAGHRVVVWEKHGCVSIGADPNQAFDLLDAASKAARIYFFCRQAGVEPEGLPSDQVEVLKDLLGPPGPLP